MIELDIVGVRVELPSNQPVVLLKDTSKERYLPIWVGTAEASAIAFAQQEIVSPRPLTHNLMFEIVGVLGHKVKEICITGVDNSSFYANIVFDNGVYVSARASDAIALALLAKVSLMCADNVVDDYGVSLDSDNNEDGETEVEKFREFLDHVAPDDFEDI